MHVRVERKKIKIVVRSFFTLTLLMSAEVIIGNFAVAQELAQAQVEIPVQTPGKTPVKTPVQAPAVTPGQIPVQAPVQTPVTTPERTPSTPVPSSLKRPSLTTPVSPQRATSKICAFDSVENLLPSIRNKQNPSPLDYLAEQGFTQSPDGSWVCYVSDPKNPGRYYTLFKVQETNGRLVASSFLEGGNLSTGQDNRSLDFFMMIVKNHTNAKEGNRQSIRNYLGSFVSLVGQGKVPASRRGYLFDQPSRSFVIYHPLEGGELKGTAITININSPQGVISNSAAEAK
jgi:hypothetical protein